MKKWSIFLLSMMLAVFLAACGNDRGRGADPGTEGTESAPQQASSRPAEVNTESAGMNQSEHGPEETGTEASETENAEDREAHVLIAYFSVPEDVDPSGVDAVAGASIVVREGDVLGNTEYVAEVIQRTVGGDLFRIETVEPYPLDHDPLVDQAAEEQEEGARPELATQIEHIDQYDTIILGYPNWWGDLPQPLYTFLEEYDLSGKTIIPFVTHGGSGFSDSRSTIAGLQPGASVSDNTLSLSRNSVADSEAEGTAWAESLGVN